MLAEVGLGGGLALALQGLGALAVAAKHCIAGRRRPRAGGARACRRRSGRRRGNRPSSPRGSARSSPASASSFRWRLMRGWLWPRIWVRSLTLSSPAASSSRMRSRVGSAAALSAVTRCGISRGNGHRSMPETYKHMFICQGVPGGIFGTASRRAALTWRKPAPVRCVAHCVEVAGGVPSPWTVQTVRCLPLRSAHCQSISEHSTARVTPIPVLGARAACLALLFPFVLLGQHLADDPATRAVMAHRPTAAIQLFWRLLSSARIFGGRSCASQSLASRAYGRDRLCACLVSERGIFARRTWSEPLAHYAGVAHRVRASLSGLRHELILVHRNPSRTILLAVANRIAPEEVARVANLLGLAEISSREAYRLSLISVSSVQPSRSRGWKCGTYVPHTGPVP